MSENDRIAAAIVTPPPPEEMERLLNDVAQSIYADAQRYRWLRSMDHGGLAAFEIDAKGRPDEFKILIGGHLDDAIDAAIRQANESQRPDMEPGFHNCTFEDTSPTSIKVT